LLLAKDRVDGERERRPLVLQAIVQLQNWSAHVMRRRSTGLDALGTPAEYGATAVEYALIVSLIFLAIIASVGIFSDRLNGTFGTYTNTIPA
jgi:Flp pilus assembly pilin Flp